MKLLDKLALARAGFKAKEIMEMEKAEEEAEKETEEVTEEETEEVTEEETEEVTEEVPEVDYKKRCEELEASLRKAQENNLRENIKIEDESEKIVKDMVSSFI